MSEFANDQCPDCRSPGAACVCSPPKPAAAAPTILGREVTIVTPGERRCTVDFGILEAGYVYIPNRDGSASSPFNWWVKVRAHEHRGAPIDGSERTEPEAIEAIDRALLAMRDAIPGRQREPGSEVDLAEPEQWLYARHPDDEHWETGGSTREEAIAEAFTGAKIGDVFYVVCGERPTTAQLADAFDADRMLEDMTDYGSDNGWLGEDTELEFSDAAACEAEVKAVIAKYLVRPSWWVCDGSAAEEVTFNG